MFGKRIYSFGTHTVQTGGKLEDIVAVFAAGIHDGNAVFDFVQRDTASVVADGNTVVFQFYINTASFAHDKFIDAVINDKEPCVTPEQAYTITRILEGIYTSAKTGDVYRFDTEE